MAPTPRPYPGAAEDRSAVRRLGWAEIVIGLAAYELFVQLVVAILKHSNMPAEPYGLSLNALSGTAAVVGAAAALSLRVRSIAAAGVVRPRQRWLWIAVGVGILTLLLARVASATILTVWGSVKNDQSVYADGASGGNLSILLSVLAIAVLTPIGEELLFRGVIMTALGRYGAVVAVIGSTVIFAAVHGLSAAAITAVIVGLVNAELFRRSGSIWPGVIVHAINNGVVFGITLLTAT